MSNPALESNPLHLPSVIGSEPIDKSKDTSNALIQQHPVNTGKCQNSVDIFEQARITFFSK